MLSAKETPPAKSLSSLEFGDVDITRRLGIQLSLLLGCISRLATGGVW
jgi:hypothetical protein